MRLYRRGKRGTWWCDYRAADGRRVRWSLGTTRASVADRLARALEKAEKPDSVNSGNTEDQAGRPAGDAPRRACRVPDRVTDPAPGERLDALLDRWLEENKSRHAEKVRTVTAYRQIARNIWRHLGDRPAAAVRAPDLREYQRRRLSQGIKSTTINRELVILRAALRWAGLEPPNVEPLKGSADKPQPLSGEEIEKLLGAARGTRLEPVIVLALECGLRRDEIRYLRWCDVDLGAAMLYVQRQPGWTPKSHQARVIPLSAGLATWLTKFRASVERRTGRLPRAEDPIAYFEAAPHGRRQGLGERWSGNALSAAVRKVWGQAGIPRRNRHTLHALRATFATRAMLNGGDIVSVQVLMGHSDIGTTRGYLRHDADSLRRAVRAASSLQ